MRKFFDINVPFNRLQFNICLIISIVIIGIFISCFYISLLNLNVNFEGILIFLFFAVIYVIGLTFLSSLFRRLKNLNKTNLFIINSLFLCNLLFICAYICLLHICACESLKNNILGYCVLTLSALGCIILIYLLILAMFVKGNGIENYVYTKPKQINTFNNKFWLNWKDFKGKASRNEFFISGFLLFILFPVIFYVASWLLFWFAEDPKYYYYIYFIYGIIIILFLYLISTLSVFIRRLRDIGLKPWHYIILFFPPVNILLMVLLLFLKGEKTKE